MSLKSASTSGSAATSVSKVGVVRSVVVARPVSSFLRSRRTLCIIVCGVSMLVAGWCVFCSLLRSNSHCPAL
eukprot:330511-Prorocentrum_lima.AAC.1